jgi:DNA-binding NarL/FixJ family response regulator
MLVQLLTGAGQKVVLAETTPAAFIDGVTKMRPDVAMVDLHLPNGSGFDVLEALHGAGCPSAVLVLTALEDDDVISSCFKYGAAGFLPKRIMNCDSVLRAVLAVARGERVAPVDLYDRALTPQAAAPSFAGDAVSLTPRELEVLDRVAHGDDNLKIAAILDITERTVRAHVSALYRKLAAENRGQLVLRGLQIRRSRLMDGVSMPSAAGGQ